MAESTARPESTSLRRALERLEPGIRVLAEDFLGLETTIDLVGADAEGRAVLVVVAAQGRELEAIACGLAHSEFVAPRVADWRKLAPELPLREEAGVRILVLAKDFGATARLAARGAGSERIELIRLVGARSERDPGLLLEPLDPRRTRERREPIRPSRFRTGLTAADLGSSSSPKPEILG